MDIGTIAGIITGVGLLFGAILLDTGLGLFVNYPSMMIVGGGTFAAVCVSYPLNEVLNTRKVIKKALLFRQPSAQEMVAEIVKYAKVVREQGPVAVEKAAQQCKDGFLGRGLQMIADQASTEDMSSILQNEIAIMQTRHKVGREIVSAAAKYAPAFGMVGTLIGLIQMLANLDEPSTIGPKMAVALLTTFYGAVMANLFFGPLSTKLKRRSEMETLLMKLIIEGLMSISAGDNPRVCEEKLKVFLSEKTKPEEKKAEEKARGAREAA